jgi:hypothetical protein
VVAGVVAAVRSLRPYNPGNPTTLPSAIRTLLRNTATDISPGGFDFNTGFGVVGACALRQRLVPQVINPGPVRLPESICRRFPELCYREPLPPRLPIPRPPIPFPPVPPRPPFGPSTEAIDGDEAPEQAMESAALAEMASVYEAWRTGWLVPAAAPNAATGGEGCGCKR